MVDLEAFLDEAVKFWTNVQRHHRRTIAVCKAEDGGASWDIRDQYGKVPEDAAPFDLGYPIAVLFQQIYQLQQQKGAVEVLRHGYAVWPDQHVYVEAKVEQHRIQENSRGQMDGGNRKHSIGDRRLRRSGTARVA